MEDVATGSGRAHVEKPFPFSFLKRNAGHIYTHTMEARGRSPNDKNTSLKRKSSSAPAGHFVLLAKSSLKV